MFSTCTSVCVARQQALRCAFACRLEVEREAEEYAYVHVHTARLHMHLLSFFLRTQTPKFSMSAQLRLYNNSGA